MIERDERVIIDNLMFPECPRWHDGRFYVSDFYAKEVVATDLDGNYESVVQVPGQAGGTGWLPDGGLLVVSMLDARLMMFDGAQLTEVADLSGLTQRANDMVVDDRGRAYIGGMPDVYSDTVAIIDGINSAPITDPGIQDVFMVDVLDPARGVRTVASDIKLPNGSVVTPDGRTLIIAESRAHRLIAFDIADDGTLRNQRVWAAVGDLIPDGICLDAEGQVWFAVPRPARNWGVYRVAEGGRITDKIEADQGPLACALGGPEGDYLCIVDAALLGTGQAPQLRTRGNGRARVVRVDVPAPAVPR